MALHDDGLAELQKISIVVVDCEFSHSVGEVLDRVTNLHLIFDTTEQ